MSRRVGLDDHARGQVLDMPKTGNGKDVCDHCHRPKLAGCDGRGTVEDGPCAFGACDHALDLDRRLAALKKSKDELRHWDDERRTLTVGRRTLTVLSTHGQWLVVLAHDGGLKIIRRPTAVNPA